MKHVPSLRILTAALVVFGARAAGVSAQTPEGGGVRIDSIAVVGNVRQSTPVILSDSRIESISASDWLPTLSSAQFFVCCPGSSQPTCHNLIEAMSVGTIPIIEYGDRVTPELRDGENAICFRGKIGLVEAIHRVDSLGPGQISQMRRNVSNFYDDHLCGTKFLTRLRDGGFDLTSRRVCMPFHERNFYASDRVAA